MLSIINIYIIFWLYSIMGWIMETTYVSIKDKKFVNRGFFLGPYCPIYGTGGVLLLLFFNTSNSYYNPFVIFVLSIFICSLVEYLTSYFLELIYKVRWWDYSDRFFNINGRICLFNSFCFGLLGMILVCFLNPFFVNIITNITYIYKLIIFSILLLITTTDMIVTFNAMFDFKKSIINLKDKTLTNIFKNNKDNTEEVSKKIKELIKEKSFIHKHITSSYSNFKIYKNNFFKKSEEFIKYKKIEKIENSYIIGMIISIIIGLFLGKIFNNISLVVVICLFIGMIIIKIINRRKNGK